MHKSLKSAALGAALLTAGVWAAQAQSVPPAPANPAAVPEQSARLPVDPSPFAPPAHVVAPTPDDEAANLQRELEQSDSSDGDSE